MVRSTEPLVNMVAAALGKEHGVVTVDIPFTSEQGVGVMLRKLCETPEFAASPWRQSWTRYYHDRHGKHVETCTSLDNRGDVVVHHGRCTWAYGQTIRLSWPHGSSRGSGRPCTFEARDSSPVQLRDLNEREDNIHMTRLRQSRTFQACHASPWVVEIALDWVGKTTTDCLRALRGCMPASYSVTMKLVTAGCKGDVAATSASPGGPPDPRYLVLDALLKLGYLMEETLLGKDGSLLPYKLPTLQITDTAEPHPFCPLAGGSAETRQQQQQQQQQQHARGRHQPRHDPAVPSMG